MSLPKRTTRALLGLGSAALIGHAASAELLVYEPFNYSVGLLAGQAGGEGLTGSWADGPDGGQAYVNDPFSGTWDGDITNTPTTPPPPNSKYISLGVDSGGDKFEAYRPLAQSAGDMAGGDGVLWMSAVWHFPAQGFGAHVGLALSTDSYLNRGSSISTTGSYGSGAGNAIGVGRNVANFNGDGSTNSDWNNLNPMVFSGGSVAAQSIGNSLPGGSDSLVVLKFEFSDGGADIVRAYSFTEGVTPDETSFNSNAAFTSFAIDEDTLNILTFDQNRSDNAIDEIRIGDTFDDVISGVILPPQLSLRANTTTGSLKLIGSDDGPVQINYYQITSDAGTLDHNSWDSLADQDYDGNGPADNSGNGWEEAFGSDSNVLAEAYLLSESTVPTGTDVSLGAAYDTATDAQDLVFRYRIETGQNFFGDIEYVATALGDVDEDGDIDSDDLNIAIANFTGSGGSTAMTLLDGDFDADGDVDNADLGFILGEINTPLSVETAAALNAVLVPEPGSIAMLSLAGLFTIRRRRAS